MGARTATLIAAGAFFLLVGLIGAFRGFTVGGIDSVGSGIEAVQFGIVASACFGVVALRAGIRLPLWLPLFTSVFGVLQAVLHAALLVLWFIGYESFPFRWVDVLLGPLGGPVSWLCIRAMSLRVESRFKDTNGPGPLSPA
jgi:hypothetical protein